MRKFLITQIFIFLFTFNAYSDDWLLISELFNGNKIYVDPSEIKRVPDYVEAPVKQIFANPMTTQSGRMVMGYETLARVNCEFKKVGFSGVKAFDLEGKVFYTDKNYDFWPKNVASHSAGDNIIDYLCDSNFSDHIQNKILQE